MTEIKLDESSLDADIKIDACNMLRSDRIWHGGGVSYYVNPIFALIKRILYS